MRRILFAICVLFCVSTCAFAQLSSLSGVVSDPSGAVVPGAQLELVNAGTGAQRQAVSDARGRFSFAETQPGLYELTAHANGLADVKLAHIQLLVNSPATVNVTFEKIGSVAETIAVSAGSVQVNTTDASLGNALDSHPISQLPFEARNVVGLLSIQPGVTYFGDPSTRDDYRSGAVNGGKSDQGNVLLDGVDVNDQQTRAAFTSVLRVTLDSVQEFRTTTTNGGADQGRTSGAQVALVTKSGSNDLHGALYEYTRNTLTSANSFFNNEAGVPRQKLIRNIFGAAIGGPIQKNRLFYFLNYEGRRDAEEASTTRVVPTASFRQGIFSYNKLDGTVGQLTPAQIASEIDPLGIGPSQAALKVFQAYPLPNTNSVGDGLNTSGYLFNAATPLKYDTYISRLDYQIDSAGKHTVFLRGNLQNDHLTSAGGIPQFPGQADSSVHLENSKGIAAGYTWVASPNIVSTTHYGLTRQGFDDTGVETQPYTVFRDLSQPYSSSLGSKVIIPVHQFSNDTSWTKGSHTIAFGGVARIIRVNRQDQATFSDGFANSSWFADTGNSLFAPVTDADPDYKTEFTRQMTNLLGLVSEGDAVYYYDKAGNILAPGSYIARNYADNEYELYVMDTWKVSHNFTVSGGLRGTIMPALYETHGIQTTSSVPLGQWFDERGGLAQQGLPQSQLPPLSFNLSSAAGGRPLYPFQKHIAPRISMAYSPDASGGLSKFLFGGPGKTSFRVGWGLYYDLFGQSLIQLANATALGFETQLSNPASALETTTPRFTSPTQIPAGLLPPAPPGGFPQSLPADSLSITTGLADDLRSPYTMNADFSMTREFSHGLVFQLSYVGRFSRKSLNGDDVAAPTDLVDKQSGMDYFTAASLMQQYVRAQANFSSPNPSVVKPIPFFENVFPGYAGGGLTATQNLFANYWWYYGPGNDTSALASIDTAAFGCSPCSKFGPYALFNSQYSSLAVFRSRGGGDYNGLQITLRKAFSSGMEFDVNYTLSKSMDLGSTRETDGRVISQIVNPWNPSQMRSASDYDVTHLLSSQFVIELPVGRGKMLGRNMSSFLNAVVGGWQVSGIARVSSGLPAYVDNGGFWSTNWNVEGSATRFGAPVQATTKNSLTGGPNLFPDPNTAFGQFELTYPGQSGTRNPVRGAGFFTLDAGLSKRFLMPYSEKHAVQIRAEAFNLTNTPNFDTYTANLSLGSQGSFGKYNSTLNTPRVFQFALRYDF
jgi:hypothetical protein